MAITIKKKVLPADTAELTVEAWNEEDAAEAAPKPDTAGLVVFSRDWTVQTIVSQIEAGNLELDPEFQRRNAWRDPRRSALIESFILNFPVPQVVLAENPEKPKSYIVIDGKQRLMTLAGLHLAKYREYWTKPEFTGLALLTKLNKVHLDDFLTKAQFENERRKLQNSDIRATIISNAKDESVLYNIFYRLNTGSVALASQELRQVLNRGKFSAYLLEETDKKNPLWDALGQDGPDPRLRDVELLLRMVAISRFFAEYQGNMKPFLDGVMRRLNQHWATAEEDVRGLVAQLFEAVKFAQRVYGEHLGRKYKLGRYESTLNRALFEVQVYYFQRHDVRAKAKGAGPAIKKGFQALCESDPDFLGSIESTTKSIENYDLRFSGYARMLSKVLKLKLPSLLS